MTAEAAVTAGAVVTAGAAVATEAAVTAGAAAEMAVASGAMVADAVAAGAMVTDAVATESPATENPATENPATENPATENPATESSAPSRRDRVRAATSQEIIATARRLLVTEGSAAITLRAIAREMGMTAPALYRYFGSYQTLIHHVVASIFNELSDYVEAEVAQAIAVLGLDAGQPGLAQPDLAQPDRARPDSTTFGLITACQAFRRWAIAHPAEFGMIFGTPLPGVDLYHEDPLMECGMRFGAIFMNLFVELWRIRPFPVPSDDEIAPEFRGQLARYGAQLGTDLPLGVLQTFLRCWVSLYGTVTLEVFGHMRFALDNPAQMFELMLTDLAGLLGLHYPLTA